MKKKATVIKAVHPHPTPVKRKPKLHKVESVKIEPKEPEPNSDYTHEDWQKEVAKHVKPGMPIPDWLAAKAP